ncbi:MAG: NUDIX domain-containing protein [Patescibacteria group bacterium]
MNNELHQVQISILKELLFNNGTNFASLNRLGLTSDHFTFHIKKLIKEGLVEKKARRYLLTLKGKAFASTIDVDALKLEKFGRPGVAITAKRTVDGKTHLLFHQRLKEPFYGYFGFVNGKIRFGDTTEETAVREFREETGLKGEPKNICVYHKLRGPSRREILLDNFFFVYLMLDPEGELRDSNEGRNFWFTPEEATKLQMYTGMQELIAIVMKETQNPYFERYFMETKI